MTTGTLPGAVRLGLHGWLILITLCGATFMTGLDYSVITVALPEIGRDLHFAGASALQWVATACLLPTAALMPLFGRASDMVGRRRLFIVGVATFTVFSLLAGLAPNPGLLVAARAGQGVAAAMIGPTALALMTAAFPEGPRRTRALGVNGALLSLGFVVGTIGGGLITSGLNWRWTMLILFGIGVLVMLGAITVVRETTSPSRTRLDIPGAVLASGGLFALVYGISTGGEAGWGSLPTLATLLAAVVLLGAFLVVESRSAAPLVPPRLLRRPTVTWGMTVGLVTFGMCGGATLLLSIHMQDVLGYSPLQTGLGFLGEGVAALLAGTVVARLISAAGTVTTIVVGLAVQAVGTAAMVFLPAEGGLVTLLVTSATMGFGHVLTVVAAITTITSGLDEADQGVAGSLAQMPTFVGAVGVAGLTAIVAARTEALAPTTTKALATLGGLHTAFLVAGVVALLGAVAGGLLLRRTSRLRIVSRALSEQVGQVS
ncbi:MFS transporter [Streptosporangium saharense]|uniref:EmrB/QacA subfamily drug resistance transporter n=1 Tax=Streptosporangium saharense TaxID=1706840 RepID=A0A7W7QPK6_9ACTN|nr:MFS transporter [Streptosporangium saharense]MBB4917254.1 EmrB/QacA subfamily drug resistance transporter [Streptosporangium saharense]